MQLAFKEFEVWQRAVKFAVTLIDTVEGISADRQHYRLLEQIEACSSSVSINVAEGLGWFSKKNLHNIYTYPAGLYTKP